MYFGVDRWKRPFPTRYNSPKLHRTLPVATWVLPPRSNSWISIIIWLCIALHKTPNIDCYGGRGGGRGSTQVATVPARVPRGRS